MATGERVLMGFMAVLSAVMLVDGLQRGVMLGEFRDYDANENPMRFALAVIGSIFGLLACLFFAAGFSIEDLGRLARWLAARA